MERGLTMVSFANLCHGLVSIGQGLVAGGEDGSASLEGGRCGAALLFWCEVSGVGVCVGGVSGGLVLAWCLSPPT